MSSPHLCDASWTRRVHKSIISSRRVCEQECVLCTGILALLSPFQNSLWISQLALSKTLKRRINQRDLNHKKTETHVLLLYRFESALILDDPTSIPRVPKIFCQILETQNVCCLVKKSWLTICPNVRERHVAVICYSRWVRRARTSWFQIESSCEFLKLTKSEWWRRGQILIQ